MRDIILAGGSGGLGSASARLLSTYEDLRLTVSYKQNRERAEQLGGFAQLIQADLSSADDRRKLLDAAPELYGLVVFAGDPARVKSPGEFDAALDRSWHTNFAGPILLAREAAERLKQSHYPGSIILVSTMQAVSVFPGSTAYASAKAALLHSARILAKECRGPANIRVNVICPGVNQAGMAEASIASGKYDHYLSEGIIHRFGKAEDVARAVLFFLEPDNYITGQVLTIDGGLTL
jgi:3-oxoacyl-[acyl-carrier protein] reductase